MNATQEPSENKEAPALARTKDAESTSQYGKDADPNTGSTDDSLKEFVEKLAGWFVPALGVIYACGFLVVFTFFRTFGITTVDFIQAKYIHIGFIFVMACFTIIVPIRWLYLGASRWRAEHRQELADISKQVWGGAVWNTVWEKFVKRVLWSDWKVGGKHGLHSTFPAVGSGICMVWCLLALLTFAQPHFGQRHPKLLLLNLFLPLAVFSVAFPADWIKGAHITLKYPKHLLFRFWNLFLRVVWIFGSVLCLYWFLFHRHSLDDHLHYVVLPYFGATLVGTLLTYLLLLLRAVRLKDTAQRISLTYWGFYVAQWLFFLGQCWLFLRVLIYENLQTSLRAVFFEDTFRS